MHILLTGVTGFVGSRLALRLVEAGHKVTGIKRRSSSVNRIQAHSGLTLVDAEDGVIELFNRLTCPVDVVIHSATQYGNKGEEFIDVFNSNVFFPLEILTEAARKNVRCYINIDTFFCKTTSEYEYLQSYVKTKRLFKEIGRNFAEAAGLIFINLSLEHVYGPGDSQKKFVNSILVDLIRNKSKIPLTPGLQQRDFIYIDDVTSAVEFVLCNLSDFNDNQFQHYEVGTGLSTSVMEFVEIAKNICGSTSELKFGEIPYRDNEIMESRADEYSLSKRGWCPAISLEKGLLMTVNSIK